MVGSGMVQAVRSLLPGTINSWASAWRSVHKSWPPEFDLIVHAEQASTAAAILHVDKERKLFVGRGARSTAGRKGMRGALHAAAAAALPTAEQYMAAERAAQDLLAEVQACFSPPFPVPLSQPEVDFAVLGNHALLLAAPRSGAAWSISPPHD